MKGISFTAILHKINQLINQHKSLHTRIKDKDLQYSSCKYPSHVIL